MPSVVGEITKGAAFTGIVAGEEVKISTPGALATVDGAADYLLILDATDGVVKKVLADDLPGGGDTLPIVDTTAIVKGSVDATKLVRVEADGITTGTTRVITMPDQDIDLTPGTGSFATEAEGNLAATALQNVVEDTTPQLGADLDLNGKGFDDANGNPMVVFVKSTTAVNYIQIQNQNTGGGPTIKSQGTDTNIDLILDTKNAGTIELQSNTTVTGNIAVTGTVDGRDVATDGTKLDGIESGADVTDATNVDAAGAVMETDYNAQTILAATTDDTPAALTVGEQTLVGRITGGNIAALTPAQIRTLIGGPFWKHLITPYTAYLSGVTCQMSQNGHQPIMLMDPSTDEYLYNYFHQVKGYQGGTVKLDIIFSMATADTSKAVVLFAKIFEVADGATLADPGTVLATSFSAITADTVTKSTNNAQYKMDTATITMSNSGITEGDLFVMQIGRDADNASDTHTGDLQFVAATLYEV